MFYASIFDVLTRIRDKRCIFERNQIKLIVNKVGSINKHDIYLKVTRVVKPVFANVRHIKGNETFHIEGKCQVVNINSQSFCPL